MELRIYLRHTQYQAVIPMQSQGIQTGTNIIYAGNTPSDLHPVAGTVPQPNYIEFTDYISNLDKLQITWTKQRADDGMPTPGLNNSKKSASGQLFFEDKAYFFIKDWLVDNISAYMNAIDVKIEHVGCGSYEEFVIKSSQIQWNEDDICQISLTVLQKDPAIQCLQQTMVSDNWQGWFQKTPSGGKKHPRFLYCNEARPNGLMIVLWWLLGFAALIMITLTPIILIIQFIINIIQSIIAAISWLFGRDPDWPEWNNWFDPTKAVGSWYMNSSGCGRFHPAPFIRDYIDNVCKKCGVMVDGVTDPIFHSKYINIDASSGYKEGVDNPYYYATFMNAPSQKGEHLFNGFFGKDANTDVYYLKDNKPLSSLDMFLDQIKGVFNADWVVKNVNGQPTLYFWRHDWFTGNAPIYDFSMNSADRQKILEGISYSWNDKKHPIYINGLYSEDGSDASGNEGLKYMNDKVSLGDKTNNFIYEGVLDKTTRIGATRFRLDGAGDDYIMDAVNAVYMLSLWNLNFTTWIVMSSLVYPLLRKYCDYALLLENDVFNLPKILIWDKDSGYDFAKVIRNKNTWEANGANAYEPKINHVYNENSEAWHIMHPPETRVREYDFNGSTGDYGIYATKTHYDEPALLCNYPMFFAAGYQDNLFDWFHWIDDKRNNPTLNLQWEVKIEMCCDDLKKLKVFGDSSDIKLLDKVKLPIPYYGEGTITEITVSYDSGDNDDVGKYIELKGKS